jgi:hypothetical protein
MIGKRCSGRWRAAFLAMGFGVSCTPTAATVSAAPGSAPAPTSGTEPSVEASAPHLVAGALRPAPNAEASEPCGELDCRRFHDAASAFRYVLRDRPLALGIGEAHAPAGTLIATTAARFTEQLLPVLAGRASHLIVELLHANPDCPRAEQPLAEAQKPIMVTQAPQNQNDYVALGQRARALGIEPFLLTPSCDEFRQIGAAGPDAIEKTLETIASMTTRMARAALLKNHRAGSGELVVAYGGALHNDLYPDADHAPYSYGPRLDDFTGGHYLELDLIVREFIKDDDAWRRLPWYGKFDPSLAPDACVVLRTAPRSYVLFFPSSDSKDSDSKDKDSNAAAPALHSDTPQR